MPHCRPADPGAAFGMPLELRYVCPLLQVFDMPTSLGFYRDLLGFEVVGAAPPADNCFQCPVEARIRDG